MPAGMVHMSWRDPSRLAPEGGVRYLRVTHPFPGEFRITLVVLLWIKAEGLWYIHLLTEAGVR